MCKKSKSYCDKFEAVISNRICPNIDKKTWFVTNLPNPYSSIYLYSFGGHLLCIKFKIFPELGPDTPKMDFLATSMVCNMAKATGYIQQFLSLSCGLAACYAYSAYSGRSENVSIIPLRPEGICVAPTVTIISLFARVKPSFACKKHCCLQKLI